MGWLWRRLLCRRHRRRVVRRDASGRGSNSTFGDAVGAVAGRALDRRVCRRRACALCVRTGRNGWTVSTVDGLLSAHWEHTVAITPDGPQVFTIGDQPVPVGFEEARAHR